MGSVHLDAYKTMNDVELVALCDIRMDMLKQKAEGLNVRLYDDMEEMLAAEKPDMVDICTPTYLHSEQAIKAMESGAHVLSEKPMALNSAQTEQIIAAINRTGKRYMVAHVVRFMNAYVYLRGVIESGKYGKLESLSMQRFSQTPLWSWENWFLDEKRSGHVVFDLMIHDVDFMQSVLGEPRDIVGVYRPMTDNMTNYAFANYIYDDCNVSIEGGWYNDQQLRFSANYKAVFEKGNLVLQDGKLFDCNSPVDFTDGEKMCDTGINISNVDGYAGEIKYFIECIRSGQPSNYVTPESSETSIRLVERTLNCLKKV